MPDRFVDVATADGTMPAFLTAPDEGGPFPPVVVYMDVWGAREQLYAIARRIAARGHVGVVPNLYYRAGGITFDHRHPDGRTISLKDLDAAARDRIIAYHEHLTDAMAVADTGALLAHLQGEAAVRPGPAGAIGYCMGGRHVLRVAAAYPDIFRANASLHPTRLVVAGGASPHDDAARVRGAFYIGWAERDHYAPPEVIAAVRAAFDGTPARYRDALHADTDHGYAIPDRDIYDAAAAERDWQAIFDMYDAELRF